ncbi:hypothetical protein CSX51_004098 [Escherichia coli]|nr:hypothetical protein [Escherichia coli]
MNKKDWHAACGIQLWLRRNMSVVCRARKISTGVTWVDWYNNRRLLGRLGHTPPAEAEKAYYASIGNDDLAA